MFPEEVLGSLKRCSQSSFNESNLSDQTVETSLVH